MRALNNLTQKELAARTGIDQADISKLENGTRNPSLKLLKRLAHGMGMQLKIEFVPMQPLKNKIETDAAIIRSRPLNVA